MIWKIIKYFTIVVALCAIGFIFLNLDYFNKQTQYYLSHTFVSENQRQEKRAENPVLVEPNQIIIPSLDIVAPIKFITEANETAFQAALIDGVVLYPGTAKVGEVGNMYIFGHSSDFAFSKGKFKTVFALLPKIEIGAEILVSDAEGVQFKYKVYDKFVAEKTRTDLLSQETNNKRILTVQTSYPVGTALQRYIVKAELVQDQN